MRGLILSTVCVLAINTAVGQQAVDVHCHNVFPEFTAFLDEHGAALEETFLLPHWDVKSHLDFMDKAGISRSLLSMPAPQPYYGDTEECERITRLYNEKSAELKKAYPGRFLFCASVPLPDVDADMVRIEPAEKGLDYAANNYAIGSAHISAIRNNPDNAASYPAIDPVNVNLDDYDMVIVAAPLWWSNMAAPLQTYLFHNGAKMAGKKIGLIVSSASRGISGVEADAKRLMPDGDFISPSLWIRSSQTSNCHTMIADWLTQIDYDNQTSGIDNIPSDIEPMFDILPGMMRVTGVFNSLAIYNLSGMKILESFLSRHKNV